MTDRPSASRATQDAAWFLISLAATEGHTREGIAYAGMMGRCSLDEFQAMLAMLDRAGFIARAPHFSVSITAAGREAAARVEAALVKANGTGGAGA